MAVIASPLLATSGDNQPATATKSILAIDIGGTKVKFLASGQTEPRKAPSGPKLTPKRLVEMAQSLTEGWDYEAISIGYPGLVGDGGPRSEPGNLGPGWVGYDFAAAFDRPVRMINDAAMQALGSYEGGRMLFLGLGTGLGSTLIVDKVIISLELGDLSIAGSPYLGEILSRRGLEKLGKARWRQHVHDTVATLAKSFVVDYVVIGGGNASKVGKHLPPASRLGHNLTAFRGGYRLWKMEDVLTLETADAVRQVPLTPQEWRML